MKVFCMLGSGQTFFSKAPAMYTEVLKKVGIRGVCVPFNVDQSQIGNALEGIKILNIAGVVLGAPFKESVIPHLDILSEGANIIGAVNTIVYDEQGLKGYNTNAIGFMDSVDSIGFDIAGKSILVFGSGGNARAVVFILNWLRAKTILVADKDKKKPCRYPKRLGEKPVSLNL